MVGLAEQQSCDKRESSSSHEQEVGDLFRLAREEQKKTIEDVARVTHIRRLYLTAIEEGRFDQLPGKVYVIGFIKAYAQLLGLDANELLRRLHLDDIVNVQSNKLAAAVPTESQERPSFKLVMLSSILTVVLGGSLVAWTFWEKEIRHLWEQVTATQFPLGSSGSMDEQSTSLEATYQEFKEEFSISVKDEPTVNQLSNHPEYPGHSSMEIPKIGASQNEQHGSLSAEKSDTITIIAQKDSWVQVVDGHGKSVFVRLMHAGETFQVPSENGPYQLNAGNAGGIRLRLNNATTELIGSEGKIVRSMSLVPDQIRQLGFTSDDDTSTSPDSGKEENSNP